MRNTIFLLLLLAYSARVQAIGFYMPGDTLYVWALSGLTLRAEPSIKSASLGAVPYGTVLVVQNYSGMHDTPVIAVQGFKNTARECPAVTFKGDFANVQFGGKTGYLFDGYLSKMPPFQFSGSASSPVFEHIEQWGARNFGLCQHVRKGKFEFGAQSSEKFMFGNGISVLEYSEKGDETRIILPEVSMEEAFMIFNFKNKYEWEVRKQPRQSFEDSWSFSINSPTEWQFAEGLCDFGILYLPDLRVAILSSYCSC